MTPEELAAALALALKPFNEGLAAVTAKVDALKATPPPVVVQPVVPPVVVPPVVAPPVATTPTPAENALAAEQKRQIDAMLAQVATLTATNKANEERAASLSKTNALDRILGEYNFVAPSARDTARTMLDAQSKANEAGELIANNLPVADFAKEFLTVQNPYLLAPANAAGTGATTGTGPGISRGTVATTEMIKVGMSDADRATVMAGIRAAAQGIVL